MINSEKNRIILESGRISGMLVLLLRSTTLIIRIGFGQYEVKFVADCLPISPSLIFFSLNLNLLLLNAAMWLTC